MGKDRIKITSGASDELSTSVVFGDEKYLVQTERGGPKNLNVTTHVYLEGKVLSKIAASHGDIAAKPDFEEKMRGLMNRQHQSAIETLKAQKEGAAQKTIQVREKETPSGYLKAVKRLLMRKNNRGALELLKASVEEYPNDPFLLSYYGCLEAIVNKKYRYGVDTCYRAIKSLRERVPFGEEFFYPVLYLNLGRAYLAAGKRKDAVAAFKKGLETDKENSDILMELNMLGARKRPPVTFLSRSNPINKYIGMLLHKLSR